MARLAPSTTLLLLAAAGIASVAVALAVGSVHVPWSEMIGSIDGTANLGVADIVLGLRLPRALAGFAVGALLALAGALLQALLRNPLADPYVLGISGGAAVAALLALAAGAGAAGLQIAAFGGALITLMLLFVLARRALYASATIGEHATSAVLLTGVMLASFAAALLSLVLSLAPDGRLRSMVFWLLGDLSGATDLRAALMALLFAVVLLVVAASEARALNLMLRGDLQAYTQGVRVAATRRRLVVIAALATASAVTLGGAVGFVGFVAPHLVRVVAGNDQRVTLPAATLLGGALVVVADTIARSAAAPLQLPVGVVTAMIGVPVFLWFIGRR